MVICLERGADLHMAQLMPLPLTVSCFSETQIGFTFLVPAHPGSPGNRAVKRVCVCVCVCAKLLKIRVYNQIIPGIYHSVVKRSRSRYQRLSCLQCEQTKRHAVNIHTLLLY